MTGAWTFQNPVAIHFGRGCLRGQGSQLPAGRILVLTTAGAVSRGTVQKVIGDLSSSHDFLIDAGMEPNLRLSSIEQIRARHASANPAGVLAIGGGSVLDAGKVMSLALPEGGLRVTDAGTMRMPEPGVLPLPLFAVPTTAGSGSEVTPFAAVWVPEERRKLSVSSPLAFPRAAFLDPELTASMPHRLTVATGLDALSQSLESVWNHHATPYTIMLSTRAFRLSVAGLESLGPQEPPMDARISLMEASLFSGLAISQTRTALAHSMSYPVTAAFGLEHGLACSFMLPALLRFNAVKDDGRLARLAAAAGLPSVEDLAQRLAALLRRLKVLSMMREVLATEDLDALVPLMITPERASNNLRAAATEDVRVILRDALKELEGA